MLAAEAQLHRGRPAAHPDADAVDRGRIGPLGNLDQMLTMRRSIPNSEMLILNHAGTGALDNHVVQYSRPDIVGPVVLDFLHATKAPPPRRSRRGVAVLGGGSLARLALRPAQWAFQRGPPQACPVGIATVAE